MKESELQGAIIETAQLHGWRVSHFRPALTGKGYRTPVEGNVGFPDLVLAHAGARIAFAWELKGQGGSPSLDQLEWLGSLNGRIIDARVVGAKDLDRAIDAIKRGAWPQ